MKIQISRCFGIQITLLPKHWDFQLSSTTLLIILGIPSMIGNTLLVPLQPAGQIWVLCKLLDEIVHPAGVMVLNCCNQGYSSGLPPRLQLLTSLARACRIRRHLSLQIRLGSRWGSVDPPPFESILRGCRRCIFGAAGAFGWVGGMGASACLLSSQDCHPMTSHPL